MRRLLFLLAAILSLCSTFAAAAEPEPTPIEQAAPQRDETPPAVPLVPIILNDIESLPTPVQPADTPQVLEFREQPPAGVVLTVPTGHYAELAEIAKDAIAKRAKDACIVTASVYDAKCADGTTQRRLLLTYPCAPEMVFVYKSNCTVNSQFEGTGFAQLDRLRNDDGNIVRIELRDHVVRDICAHWTLLNHGWYEEGLRPKKCIVTLHNDGIVDVSYETEDVRKYNRAVSRLYRSSTKIASR